MFILGRPENLTLNENSFKLQLLFVLMKPNVQITLDRMYFHVHSMLDIYEFISDKNTVKRITKKYLLFCNNKSKGGPK